MPATFTNLSKIAFRDVFWMKASLRDSSSCSCPAGRSLAAAASGGPLVCERGLWNRSPALPGAEVSLPTQFVVGLRFYGMHVLSLNSAAVIKLTVYGLKPLNT